MRGRHEMTMLDELLDELRGRGWPEPDRVPTQTAVFWAGARSLLVVEAASELVVSYRRQFGSWKSAAETADALDRLRAGLAPGEIPSLDPRGPSGEREVVIDGVKIIGPAA